eukprot:gene3715-4628_t
MIICPHKSFIPYNMLNTNNSNTSLLKTFTTTIIILVFLNFISAQVFYTSSEEIPVFRFNSTVNCSIQCNWFDPTIWIGNQVPTINSTVLLNTNITPSDIINLQYSQTTYNIYVDQSIQIGDLSVGDQVTLVIGPGINTTFQAQNVLVIQSGQLVLNMDSSHMNDLTLLQGGSVYFNNKTMVYGVMTGNYLSTFIISNSTVTIFGDSIFFNPSISNGTLKLYGTCRFFNGLSGDPNSNIALESGGAEFQSAGGTIGSIYIGGGSPVVFNASPMTIYNNITCPINTINLVINTAIIILGQDGSGSTVNTLDIQAPCYATFANASSVNINLVMADTLSVLNFHNCTNVTLGQENYPTSKIGQLGLSGSTQLTFASVANITNTIVPTTPYSDQYTVDNISIQVLGNVTLLADSYLYNCSITVASFARLNFAAEFKIKQSGGIIVQAYGSMNFYTNILSNYILGDQGLFLGDYASCVSVFSNISGSIQLNGIGSTYTSKYTFIFGDVLIQGENSTLNVNVGLPTTQGINFESNSIQQSAKTNINIYLLPTYYLKKASVGVKTNSTNLQSMVNIYVDSSYKGTYLYYTFDVLQSNNYIQGNYLTNVLDINNNNQYLTSMYYKLKNDGVLISIDIGKRLAKWAIALIVIGSFIGVVLLVSVIIIVKKRMSKRHEYDTI